MPHRHRRSVRWFVRPVARCPCLVLWPVCLSRLGPLQGGRQREAAPPRHSKERSTAHTPPSSPSPSLLSSGSHCAQPKGPKKIQTEITRAKAFVSARGRALGGAGEAANGTPNAREAGWTGQDGAEVWHKKLQHQNHIRMAAPARTGNSKRVRPAVSTAACSSARVLKPQSPERTAQAHQEEEEEEEIRSASMGRYARQSEGAAVRAGRPSA